MLLFYSLLAAAAAFSQRDFIGETTVQVETRLGTVQGREGEFLGRKVRSFLSVPFAEPPTGSQRFRPPVAKKPWSGVIETTEPSPACLQGRDNYNTSFWGSEMWNANTPQNEDCLYLNIWTPTNAYNLTVMVWLFGGGYWYGSPSLILYDGRALALTGNVIVVNINYRIGPFGYLYFDHPDAPGNMGMLDQQLALQWIRANIFAFGGNPDRVTLFGESAGASSIVAHLIAPGSQRLFRHSILQSGTLDNKWSMDTPRRAREKSLKLATLVGCNRTTDAATIACLREAEPTKLIDSMWNELAFLEFPFVIVSRDRHFFKHKDGFVALRNGDFTKGVNLMFGINHDEGNFWNIYNLPDYFNVPEQPMLTRQDFYKCVDIAFASQPEVIQHAAKFVYSDPKCNGTGKSKYYAEQVNQMVGDYFFTCDSLWLADKVISDPSNNADVYIYYFDQTSSANPWPTWTGVMHGYEIEFVFGIPLYNATAGYTDREKLFSRKIIEYWSSFATTGAPSLHSAKNHAYWPKYDLLTRQWMTLKAGSHLAPTPAKKRVECELWRHSKDIEYHHYVASTSSVTLPSSPLFATLLYCLITFIVDFRYF